MPRPAARQRPTGPALLTVVVALALTPAAATAATVRVSTSGNDSTCTRDGTACATLGQGVAIAAPGDVVAVGAGDFPVGATDGAGVRITKPLDLRGAQYNVDARTRSGAETVLHPALGAGPYQGLLYVDTGAAGTSIRGFRIQGTAASGGLGGAGIYTEQSGTDGGYTIGENVLANNSIGLLLHASGSVVTTVARNAFLANTVGADAGGAAGNAIYSERAHNVHITDNRFAENASTGVLTAVGAANTGTDNVFARNESVGEGGPTFVNQERLTVEHNTITGGNFAGIGLGGDGLRDAQITDNVITGKTGRFANGIRLVNFGAAQNRDVTIARNTVTGLRSSDPTRGNGISLGPEGAAGALDIHRNRLVDNSGAGLRSEDPDAQIDARDNWWGCNNGPGAGGCDPVTSPDGGRNPAFTPWLTLSLDASDAQIPAGGAASLLARLANRSNGGLADGPFFSTAGAAFASTPAGTFRPPSAPLTGADLTAASAFTAGAQPEELRVTVDHQTVTILNSDPPAPDVIPAVVPGDRTLTPDQRIPITIRLVNRGNRTARRLQACLRLSAQLRLTGARCRQIARLRPGHTLILRVLARARLNVCRSRITYRLALRLAGRRSRTRRAIGRLLAGPCGPPRPCPAAASARHTRPAGLTAAQMPARRPPRAAPVRAYAAC